MDISSLLSMGAIASSSDDAVAISDYQFKVFIKLSIYLLNKNEHIFALASGGKEGSIVYLFRIIAELLKTNSKDEIKNLLNELLTI